MALTPQQEQLFIVELKKMGKEQVRARLSHGTISEPFVPLTWDWLSAEEAEEKRRLEASNSEQIELSRRAAAAAELQAREARRATTIAAIALAMAIISIIVSAIGIWLPYWNALK